MAEIKMNTIEIDTGEKLFYRERAGEGTPLVMIHGNLFSSVIFETLIGRLDDSLHVVAPDMRGFGKSTYNQKADRVETYAEDIKAFINSMGFDKVHLLGMDFGGLIAMRLGVDEPDMIEKMILLSSYSVAGRPIRKRALGGLIKTKSMIRTTEAMKEYIKPVEKYKANRQQWFIKQMLNKDIFTVDKPNDRAEEKFIEAFIQQRNLAEVYIAITYFNIFSDENGVVDGENVAKDLNMPILNLHGDKNEAVPVGVAKFNERAIGKNVETHIMNGVSHVPFIDDEKATGDYIKVFLAKNHDKRK